MKTCIKCGEVKALTEFYKSKPRCGDRLRGDCKSCAKARAKARYEANPEKIKASDKARYEANSEKIKARSKDYYEANSEKVKARRKDYYEANSEKIKARSKDYSGTPEGRLSAYRGSAKQRNIPFLLAEEEFESFWRAPCSYCGDEIKTIGLDRVDSDGPYRIDNVRPCCWPCNSNKGTRSLKEWTENTLKRAKMLNPEEFNK